MLTETISTTTTTTEPAFEISNYKINDEDLPGFTDLEFEHINELHLDHPGANDLAYRERRDYIASLARKFRETGEITDVDYTPREQSLALRGGRIGRITAKYASPFYLKAKRFGHYDRTNSAIDGNEPPFEGIDGISSRADRRFG